MGLTSTNHTPTTTLSLMFFQTTTLESGALEQRAMPFPKAWPEERIP